MKHLKAFLLGLRECKTNWTTRVSWQFDESYDRGRAFGRWLLRVKED